MCFVNLIINAIYESASISGFDLVKSTIEHIYWIFYSRALSTLMPNCTPLWFLPCLFLCTVYMFFLISIKNKWYRYIICLVGLILNYAIIYFDIPQLAWHIDSSLVGGVLMLIGYEIKCSQLLSGNRLKFPVVFIMFIIGTISIFLNPNSAVFSANRYGNQIFMFLGALFVSYACLWVCNYLKENYFLSYMGRGTILVMAFNYFYNLISGIIWRMTPIIKNYTYAWWIKSIIVTILCYVTIYVWDKIKNKYPQIAIF